MSRAAILRWAAILTLAGAFLGIAVLPGVGKKVMLDSQAQGCLPWHLYWNLGESDAPLKPGDLVIFDTSKMRAIDPHDAYSKLKMVAAVAGQSVAVHDDAIWVNGQYWGRFWIAPWVRNKKLTVDAPWFKDGRAIDGTWTVPPGDVLLLGTEPYSFDGRYWGFLPAKILRVRAAVI